MRNPPVRDVAPVELLYVSPVAELENSPLIYAGVKAVVDPKAVAHSVVDAVRGMTYPACNANASVPAVVIGLPDMVRPVGTVAATDVTVPDPDTAAHSIPKGAVDDERNTVPAVPIGSLLYRTRDEVPTNKSPLVEVDQPVPPAGSVDWAIACDSARSNAANEARIIIMFRIVFMFVFLSCCVNVSSCSDGECKRRRSTAPGPYRHSARFRSFPPSLSVYEYLLGLLGEHEG